MLHRAHSRNAPLSRHRLRLVCGALLQPHLCPYSPTRIGARHAQENPRRLATAHSIRQSRGGHAPVVRGGQTCRVRNLTRLHQVFGIKDPRGAPKTLVVTVLSKVHARGEGMCHVLACELLGLATRPSRGPSCRPARWANSRIPRAIAASSGVLLARILE